MPFAGQEILKRARLVLYKLVYPAVLGGVLVWFGEVASHAAVEGMAQVFAGCPGGHRQEVCHEGIPCQPALQFFAALIIVLYIPSAFYYSESELKLKSDLDGCSALFIDCLEVVAIPAIFYCLGYMEHAHKLGNMSWVFFWFVVLTGSSLAYNLMHNRTHDRENSVLISFLLVLFSILGMVANCVKEDLPGIVATPFTIVSLLGLLSLIICHYFVRDWPPVDDFCCKNDDTSKRE